MVVVGHVGLSNLLIAKMKIFPLLFVSFFSSFGMRKFPFKFLDSFPHCQNLLEL